MQDDDVHMPSGRDVQLFRDFLLRDVLQLLYGVAPRVRGAPPPSCDVQLPVLTWIYLL